MTMSTENWLNLIAALTQELEEYDTKLNDMIGVIEKMLRSVVSTRISTSMPDGGRLVYGKLDGAWRLIVEQLDGNDKERALSSMPRDARAAVFSGGIVESLLRDASDQINNQIVDRRAALEVASRICDALVGATKE